jgi:hypothetical protein
LKPKMSPTPGVWGASHDGSTHQTKPNQANRGGRTLLLVIVSTLNHSEAVLHPEHCQCCQTRLYPDRLPSSTGMCHVCTPYRYEMCRVCIPYRYADLSRVYTGMKCVTCVYADVQQVPWDHVNRNQIKWNSAEWTRDEAWREKDLVEQGQAC